MKLHPDITPRTIVWLSGSRVFAKSMILHADGTSDKFLSDGVGDGRVYAEYEDPTGKAWKGRTAFPQFQSTYRWTLGHCDTLRDVESILAENSEHRDRYMIAGGLLDHVSAEIKRRSALSNPAALEIIDRPLVYPAFDLDDSAVRWPSNWRDNTPALIREVVDEQLPFLRGCRLVVQLSGSMRSEGGKPRLRLIPELSKPTYLFQIRQWLAPYLAPIDGVPSALDEVTLRPGQPIYTSRPIWFNHDQKQIEDPIKERVFYLDGDVLHVPAGLPSTPPKVATAEEGSISWEGLNEHTDPWSDRELADFMERRLHQFDGHLYEAIRGVTFQYAMQSRGAKRDREKLRSLVREAAVRLCGDRYSAAEIDIRCGPKFDQLYDGAVAMADTQTEVYTGDIIDFPKEKLPLVRSKLATIKAAHRRVEQGFDIPSQWLHWLKARPNIAADIGYWARMNGEADLAKASATIKPEPGKAMPYAICSLFKDELFPDYIFPGTGALSQASRWALGINLYRWSLGPESVPLPLLPLLHTRDDPVAHGKSHLIRRGAYTAIPNRTVVVCNSNNLTHDYGVSMKEELGAVEWRDFAIYRGPRALDMTQPISIDPKTGKQAGTTTCKYPDQYEAISAGLSEPKSLCKSCDHRDACPIFKFWSYSLETLPPIIVATHVMGGLGIRVQPVNKTPQYVKASTLVFDEDPLSALFPSIPIGQLTCTKAVSTLDDPPRHLYEAAQKIDAVLAAAQKNKQAPQRKQLPAGHLVVALRNMIHEGRRMPPELQKAIITNPVGSKGAAIEFHRSIASLIKTDELLDALIKSMYHAAPPYTVNGKRFHDIPFFTGEAFISRQELHPSLRSAETHIAASATLRAELFSAHYADTKKLPAIARMKANATVTRLKMRGSKVSLIGPDKEAKLTDYAKRLYAFIRELCAERMRRAVTAKEVEAARGLIVCQNAVAGQLVQHHRHVCKNSGDGLVEDDIHILGIRQAPGINKYKGRGVFLELGRLLPAPTDIRPLAEAIAAERILIEAERWSVDYEIELREDGTCGLIPIPTHPHPILGALIWQIAVGASQQAPRDRSEWRTVDEDIQRFIAHPLPIAGRVDRMVPLSALNEDERVSRMRSMGFVPAHDQGRGRNNFVAAMLGLSAATLNGEMKGERLRRFEAALAAGKPPGWVRVKLKLKGQRYACEGYMDLPSKPDKAHLKELALEQTAEWPCAIEHIAAIYDKRSAV